MIQKENNLSKAILLSISAILVTTSALLGQTPAGQHTIDNSIKDYMQESHVPGLAACVVKDDSIVWSGVYGKANIKEDVGMSLDGIMNIASISKTFTATAAMQLWEKGLITLDRDVSEYVGFKVRNPKHPKMPITIFQIMTHTSSIKDGRAYGESYACGDPTMSLNDWIFNNLSPEGKYYNKGDSFGKWKPGEKGEYSNVAFGLLGLIVEKVSGTLFSDYCKQHIFDPVGMKHTGWYLTEVDTAKYVRPYDYVTEENLGYLRGSKLFPKGSDFKVGSFVEHCLYSFPNYPDGLVRTSINDLSLYLRAMINGGQLDGKTILKKETLNKMLSLQIEGNDHQGLCWFRREIQTNSGSHKLWSHSGGDPGVATQLYFNPENKIGVITFQNRSTGGSDKIVERLYLAAVEF